MANKLPLNGTKTHPLSDFAKGVLRDLCDAPIPRQEINAGVANRLEREDLVECIALASPYKNSGGKTIKYLCITDAGRAALTPHERT